ncbi:MAG TPA: carboxypeptidase-like regulatory domain-containing protein [Pyrinomonadaceae bacterium]|nr:carboxypeptidase-like regulatory domain-containing protein [Pyrinomonadaceae bacterium]
MNYRYNTPLKFLGVVLLTALLGLTTPAQQDYANLEGVVRDANGGVIPNATVIVRSAELSVERTTTTSEEGIYTVVQLRPGTYTVTATQQGFSTANVPELVLGVGQSRTLDIELAAGAITDQVTVTAAAEAATLDTSSARLGANVTAREVEGLPVNGRNVSQLYTLAPGATNTGTGNFSEIRFNARSNEQNQSRLDGIESTAVWDASPGYLTVQGSQFRLQTSLENIQEFRVDSSNYPAEYGTGTGGQINVIGKSGSSSFRGSLFHYFRNDVLDARNFFDGADKSKLRLNQFGGSLGGRIIRDRLFFFGSYEGLRQRAGFNNIELTPSTLTRDFITSGGVTNAALLFPNSTNTGTTVTAADQLRVQALRDTGAINAFPAGSGAFLLGGLAQFVQTNRVAQLDEDAFSVRFDGIINSRFNIYGRYQRDKGDLISPDGTTGRDLVATQMPDNFVVSLQQVYGSSIVNETKFGINRSPTTLATSVPSVSGLNGLDLTTTAFNLSGSIVQAGVNGSAPVSIAGPGGLTRQSSAGNGRAQPINGRSYSFIDNLSVTRGIHALKFGGEIRRVLVDFDQLGGVQLTYGSIGDFALNRNLTIASIGDLSAPGDFRIATNPLTTISRPLSGDHRGRQHYLIGYAQDEWRIRQNFTINFGLRYEFYSVNREQDDRAVLFDVGQGRLVDPSTKFYTAKKGNFGPRLAFTYAPARFNNKTVIRVGGGLYFGPGQYEDLIQPIESDVFRTTTTVANGLTTSNAVFGTGPTILQSFTPRAYDVNGYSVPERVGQYGASIQQELPGNTVLTVAYVGSQGRNLFQRNITNRILPGVAEIVGGGTTALPAGVGIINRRATAGGPIVAVTTVREFDLINQSLNATTGEISAANGSVVRPFGEIDYKTSGGRDSYNALQVTINRRFAAGLTLGGQYQWGHSIGTTQGSNEAQTAQNPYDFNEERGNNTFDIRHSANFSALYELPVGENRLFDLGGAGNAIFRGLQIGGIYNGRSGKPLDLRITRADVVIQCVNTAGCGPTNSVAAGTVGRFTAPSATSPLPAGYIAVINTPGGSATRNTRRPDLMAGVNPYLGDGDLRFLNPAAFTVPRPGTYGNLSRNALYGPTFHQFDLTLQKRFPITETTNIEFRTEIYNLLNRANFDNPPATIAESLPTISSTGVPATGFIQPGQPITDVRGGNFGLINSTVGRMVGLGTNRQIQFALRLNF